MFIFKVHKLKLTDKTLNFKNVVVNYEINMHQDLKNAIKLLIVVSSY